MVLFNMMNFIKNKLLEVLVFPIKSCKKEYLPLLCIYFAFGASGLASIALTFWEKEALTLTPEQLISIGVWVSFPWTLKMVVGQMVDHVSLFGSRRKVYIYIGAILQAIATFILWGLIKEYDIVLNSFGGVFGGYLAFGMLSAIGFMVQDVTADTMSTEVVIEKDEEKRKKAVSTVQVLGRLALMGAIVATSGLGGYLAGKFQPSDVVLMTLVLPVISCLGAFFVKVKPAVIPKKQDHLDKKILFGALAFTGFSLYMAFSDIALKQEIIFGGSILIVGGMLLYLLSKMEASTKNFVGFTLLAIFVSRLVPPVGPGMQWWVIDAFGFTPEFFGVLAQTGSIIALVSLWLLSDVISSKPVHKVVLGILIVEIILALPEMAAFWELHETIGVSAKSLFFFDTALGSPLVHIAMIPMLTVIALYAPNAHRGTWFAIAASFMNLALTGKKLISKYLNQTFVVERSTVETIANYEPLGDIFVWKLCIMGALLIVTWSLFRVRTQKVLKT